MWCHTLLCTFFHIPEQISRQLFNNEFTVKLKENFKKILCSSELIYEVDIEGVIGFDKPKWIIKIPAEA